MNRARKPMAHVRPRIIDAEAAATYLGVPVSWVREQTRREAIPYIRHGCYVRFELDQLDVWIADRTHQPAGSRQA